jgi:peptidyl-prolyl cis-trans isomerase B (cyclophilin B)
MIQSGDPATKNSNQNKTINQEGKLNYLVPAEFFKEYFHKRGALAAARQADRVNPMKQSSPSQFYIVQGEKYTNGQLDTLLMMKNEGLKKRIFNFEAGKVSNKLNQFSRNNDQESINKLLTEIQIKTDSLYDETKKYELNEKQREIYTTLGGYPSLDGDYTVFGEVVDGMDVVDKIAAAETNQSNRPLDDVIILKMEVLN